MVFLHSHRTVTKRLFGICFGESLMWRKIHSRSPILTYSQTTSRWINVKIQKEHSKANRRKDWDICMPLDGREVHKLSRNKWLNFNNNQKQKT